MSVYRRDGREPSKRTRPGSVSVFVSESKYSCGVSFCWSPREIHQPSRSRSPLKMDEKTYRRFFNGLKCMKCLHSFILLLDCVSVTLPPVSPLSLSRMQRCKQSGVLPTGTEVQVLQPCVLQTDVLQDLPGALTLGARERHSKERARQKKKEWKMEGGCDGTERKRRKQGRLTNSGPVEDRGKDQHWGKRSKARMYLFITPDPPALHHGGIQTTAQPARWHRHLLIFTSVKWNPEDYCLWCYFFIIIIIIDIIVSLPPCRGFDVWMNPKCWTRHSERMYPGDGGVDSSVEEGMGVERDLCVRLLSRDKCDGAIGRQTLASVHFCVNTLPITAQMLTYDKRNPICVLYIYCIILNIAETLSSNHVFVR